MCGRPIVVSVRTSVGATQASPAPGTATLQSQNWAAQASPLRRWPLDGALTLRDNGA